VKYLAIIVLAVAAAFAQQPVAQLPQKFVDTSWVQPTGTVRAAHTSLDLKQALSMAVLGDVIVLDAGATYVGNFQLYPKTQSPANPQQWIYIVSSALAMMPAGVRVSPADAPMMPKIVTQNVAADFQVNGGANHYRLAGLELTTNSQYIPNLTKWPGQGYMYFLVGSQSHPVPLPDSIIIDRCYIHGTPTQDVVTAVQATASNYALIDSYISEIHAPGQDSQAFGSYDSPGPFLVRNNYLEAAGENLMFGGAGGNNNRGVPSDITATGNYLFKPLRWAVVGKGGTIPPGNQWVEKNAFELKSAQRVLFDSNVIENVWAAGQVGYAIPLTVRSGQSGDFAVVNDVTISNNLLKNVTSFVNTLAADDTCHNGNSYPQCGNAGSQDRWNIASNVIESWFDPKLLGGARNNQLSVNGGYDHVNGHVGALRDVVFQGNVAPGGCWFSVFFSGNNLKPPFTNLTSNLWFIGNTLCSQPSGDWGYTGTTGLQQYMGQLAPLNPRFTGNTMHANGGKTYTWPPNNVVVP